MTQEEKAKAYDDAIERARIWKDKSGMPKDKQGILDDIFPELKESEDEMIRKSIIGFLITISSLKDGRTLSNEDFDSKVILEWANWLEKQGNNANKVEQKPAWSEEDEIYFDWLITVCERIHYKSDPQVSPKSALKLRDWLKSLKDRVGYEVNCTTTKEWSVEDEVKMNRIVACLEILNVADYDILLEDVDWLKSLKNRVGCEANCTTTWKPSEEQMKILLSEVKAWTKGCHKQVVLESLYNDLKKLREE